MPPQAPIADLPDSGLRWPDLAEKQQARLLRGATIVDVAGGSLRHNADVLIADGRIQQLGEGLAAQGAVVVDLAGRYLMPGLIDLHVHPGMMVGLRMDPSGQSP